jgi:hypothetical protein
MTTMARCLDPLGRGLERLCQVIDDVLVIEKLEQRDARSAPVEVPLGPMMEEALVLGSRDARDKGIAFQARFDPTLMLWVDPHLTVVALRTVIDNAVRLTDRGNVDIDVEDCGAEVAVHVRDHCKESSTVVNLVVSRRTNEAQGWAISARCSLDVGCHVCLILPKSATETSRAHGALHAPILREVPVNVR